MAFGRGGPKKKAGAITTLGDAGPAHAPRPRDASVAQALFPVEAEENSVLKLWTGQRPQDCARVSQFLLALSTAMPATLNVCDSSAAHRRVKKPKLPAPGSGLLASTSSEAACFPRAVSSALVSVLEGCPDAALQAQSSALLTSIEKLQPLTLLTDDSCNVMWEAPAVQDMSLLAAADSSTCLAVNPHAWSPLDDNCCLGAEHIDSRSSSAAPCTGRAKDPSARSQPKRGQEGGTAGGGALKILSWFRVLGSHVAKCLEEHDKLAKEEGRAREEEEEEAQKEKDKDGGVGEKVQEEAKPVLDKKGSKGGKKGKGRKAQVKEDTPENDQVKEEVSDAAAEIHPGPPGNQVDARNQPDQASAEGSEAREAKGEPQSDPKREQDGGESLEAETALPRGTESDEEKGGQGSGAGDGDAHGGKATAEAACVGNAARGAAKVDAKRKAAQKKGSGSVEASDSAVSVDVEARGAFLVLWHTVHLASRDLSLRLKLCAMLDKQAAQGEVGSSHRKPADVLESSLIFQLIKRTEAQQKDLWPLVVSTVGACAELSTSSCSSRVLQRLCSDPMSIARMAESLLNLALTVTDALERRGAFKFERDMRQVIEDNVASQWMHGETRLSDFQRHFFLDQMPDSRIKFLLTSAFFCRMGPVAVTKPLDASARTLVLEDVLQVMSAPKSITALKNNPGGPKGDLLATLLVQMTRAVVNDWSKEEEGACPGTLLEKACSAVERTGRLSEESQEALAALRLLASVL